MSCKSLKEFSRFTRSVIILVLMVSVYIPNVNAQTVDDIAPLIEFEEIPQVQANLAQVFTVQIAENELLKDATLYYRREGQVPFVSASMSPLGNSGYYTASIDTDPSDLRPIEYYIQARDAAGNRTVSGFAFDPYRRIIVATQSSAGKVREEVSTPALKSVPESATSTWYNQTWIKVTLGIVAVGVLASALDSESDNRQVVPVTINLQ